MKLLGWPFERAPLRHGVERGICWAICVGPSAYRPSVNGYAQIPAECHPWSGITDYGEIDELLVCPGGLTFGPLPACGGWIGFDTSHGFDVWTDEALAEAGAVREPWPLPGPDPFEGLAALHEHVVSWTVADVEEAAKGLARQIGNVPSVYTT